MSEESARRLWPNAGLSENFSENRMGNKIITEADRKRTPAPKQLEGMKVRRDGGGQKASLERGVATRTKKNPGKRAHSGG